MNTLLHNDFCKNKGKELINFLPNIPSAVVVDSSMYSACHHSFRLKLRGIIDNYKTLKLFDIILHKLAIYNILTTFKSINMTCEHSVGKPQNSVISTGASEPLRIRLRFRIRTSGSEIKFI